MHTGVRTTIPLGRDGYSSGYVDLPWSIDQSPYFRVRLPFFQRKSGAGSRLLLLGGCHGDEYDGPIVLFRLIRQLEDCDLHGEIVIIPSLNAPAAESGSRCSPLDSGNLNRVFGTPMQPGPTWQIANYLESTVFPHFDVVLDLHSGGTTMEHLACGLCEPHSDPQLFDRQKKLLEALQLPVAFFGNNPLDSPTSMGAANRCNIVGIGTELGGGGTVTGRSVETAAKAIDNLLRTLGLTDSRLLTDGNDDSRPLQFLRFGAEQHFIYADAPGWFEPTVALGDCVSVGDLAGYMHDPHDPRAEPRSYQFASDGIVLARRLPVPAVIGDCLLAIGESETDKMQG